MNSDYLVQPNQRFRVEYVSLGITREWSANRELCIFNINNGYQETIDAWASDVKAVLTMWESATPCLMLHDFHNALGFNRYFRKRFETLVKHRPDFKRRVAVVVPDDPIAGIISSVIDEQRCKVNSAAHWEVFTTRRQALTRLTSREAL